MSEAVIRQYVAQKVAEPFQARFMELFGQTLKDAETLWQPKKLSPTPFYPKSGELGVAEITPRLCFNIPTFRKSYTATGWQTGPVATDFKTSRYTYIIVGGYENLEAVVRSVEIQWNIGGSVRTVEDLRELPRTLDNRVGCDPFDIAPEVSCYFDVNIEAVGYDHLRPIGLVIAPYDYLKSRTFSA